MIRAYAEEYLNDAMKNLGEAVDYAVNACHIDMTEFMQLFLISGYAEAFGKGAPKIVVGLSGTELVMEVIRKSGMTFDFPEPQTDFECSPEYWCGWILAYCQWYTGRTFQDILDNISMSEIMKLYPILHEASEDKFIDTLYVIIKRKNAPTKLQQQRKKCGLSQKALSEKSEVNLRTLQQYEVRAKDINKAAASSLSAIASVLGCKIEDLLEYKITSGEE